MTSFIPCESTADPEVQFLTSIYRQSLVPVGFSESVHSVTDIRVLWWSWTLRDTLYDHYHKTYSSPLNGIQHLRWYNTNKSRKCTLKKLDWTPQARYMDNLRLYFLFNRFRLTSKQMFSPSYHNPTTGQIVTTFSFNLSINSNFVI